MEEILAPDMLTLRAHTRAAGDEFTTDSHRTALAEALPKSKVFKVHRQATLAGYTYLWPKGGGLWHVGGFGLHPDFYFGRVIASLLMQLKDFEPLEAFRPQSRLSLWFVKYTIAQ